MFKFRFWPVAAGKENSRRVERGECSSCIAPTRSPRQPAACLVSRLVTGLLASVSDPQINSLLSLQMTYSSRSRPERPGEFAIAS